MPVSAQDAISMARACAPLHRYRKRHGVWLPSARCTVTPDLELNKSVNEHHSVESIGICGQSRQMIPRFEKASQSGTLRSNLD